MAEDKRRKVAFYLYPETSAADKYLCDELEAIPTKERGRVMRALLLAGGALRQQDSRLPGMLSEMLTDATTRQQFTDILRAIMPDVFGSPAQRQATAPEPAAKSNEEATAANFRGQFGVED